MIVPSLDGITLENSISLQYFDNGTATTYRGRAYLQLQIPTAQRILWQTQPKSVYAFVWDLSLFVSIMNDAFGRAYTALLADGAPLVAGQQPFVSYDASGSGIMSLTAYPFSVWAEDAGGNLPASYGKIYMNIQSLAAVNGWLLRLETDPAIGIPPNPFGEDIYIRLVNNGLNYLPRPAAGIAGPAPTAPATSSITFYQPFRTVFPSVTNIRLVSTLPTAPEAVPGSDNLKSAILTDFRPDSVAQQGSELLVFNAGTFGECRWIKMTNNGPLTQFSLMLETVDWLGTVRPFNLIAPGAEATCKLAFAPKKMIDNWDDKRKIG
jgi:hypothetical protein